MTIFGKHLWCSYKKWTEHVDLSDICFWSSGFVEYRYCKECDKLEYRKATKNMDNEYIFPWKENIGISKLKILQAKILKELKDKKC
jgi:hypothetical protein